MGCQPSKPDDGGANTSSKSAKKYSEDSSNGGEGKLRVSTSDYGDGDGDGDGDGSAPQPPPGSVLNARMQSKSVSVGIAAEFSLFELHPSCMMLDYEGTHITRHLYSTPA